MHGISEKLHKSMNKERRGVHLIFLFDHLGKSEQPMNNRVCLFCPLPYLRPHFAALSELRYLFVQLASPFKVLLFCLAMQFWNRAPFPGIRRTSPDRKCPSPVSLPKRRLVDTHLPGSRSRRPRRPWPPPGAGETPLPPMEELTVAQNATDRASALQTSSGVPAQISEGLPNLSNPLLIGGHRFFCRRLLMGEGLLIDGCQTNGPQGVL